MHRFCLLLCLCFPVAALAQDKPERKPAALGVQVSGVDPKAERKGAVVIKLFSQGAAARAGLRLGDLIVAIDAKAITGAADVVAAMRAYKMGDTVQIKFRRDGQEHTLAVALGQWQDMPFLVLDSGRHTALIRQVLFTPDGRELITVSHDKTIRVWDVARGEPLRVLRTPIGTGNEGQLYAAALSPDGKTLAVGGKTGSIDRGIGIYLIALATGRLERVLWGHTSVIQALAFSPDGTRLASGGWDQSARIWDVATGTNVLTLKGHTDNVKGVAFSRDGQWLATASFDKTGRIWSVATGESQVELRGHTQPLFGIAWSPDGRTVATAGEDEAIVLWEPNGALRQRFANRGNDINSVAFSADSRRLLYTAGGPRKNLRRAGVLDLSTGKEQQFDRHADTPACGAFSPDGTRAATADAGGVFFVWKTADRSVVSHSSNKDRCIYSAAWSPDGTAVAWGNHKEGSSVEATCPLERSFNLTNLEFGAAPDQQFRRAQFSRGSVSLEWQDDKTVAVKRGGAKVADLSLGKETIGLVRCFTLMPGDRAAIGHSFGLHLFDTLTGKILSGFDEHMGEVWAVAPSPDGRYLLSACTDQVLRVFDVQSRFPLLSLFVAGNDWIVWTSQGYYAASPGGERLMGWHIHNGREQMASFYPAAQFHKTFYRPDVIRRVLETGSVEKALALADQARGKPTERTDVSRVLPPKVVITSPERTGQRLARAELVVRATAQAVGNQPVTALRLLLNGRPYQGQAGAQTISPPKLAVEASWTVQLTPGKHRLTVQADSAVSQGLSDEIEVIYVGETQTEDELPSLYVLAIGIAAYPGALKLNYAAKDAQAIEQVFKTNSKSLFRKVEVQLLTDQQATRNGILKGLSWLRKQMTQRDVGVLFFAGHGQRDADGRFYLLPVDGDVSDLLVTAVPDDDVKRALQGMPGRVLALLDACHSGAVDGDKRRAAGGLTDDLVRDLVTDDYGVVVLASSMGREFSLESNEHRQGYFTLALTEALSGKAARSPDGAVYLHQLEAYVQDRVKELTKGRQHPVTAKPTSIRSFPLARP